MPAPPPPSHFSPPQQRPTAIAIVGTDAVLAAYPATPVQIAHALQRLGFDVVVPASWGDELLATATLAHLEERGGVPAVFCACPRVAERLMATGRELAPVLLPLVTPPVATARYVRAAYAGARVTVTYVGGCPGAADGVIDARITPREFLRALGDRGVVLADLPRVFEGVIPPDRRRHLSLPGGLPDEAALASLASPRRLACLTSADYAAELAQLVIARDPVLIDVAARLGCACAGATAATPFEHAHETVTRLEPPRASSPVVDASLIGPLDAPLPDPPVRAPAPTPAEAGAPPAVRTPTPPQPMPPVARISHASPAAPMHPTPPGGARYPGTGGEPPSGPSRRRGGVRGFFRGHGNAEQPRAMTGDGIALPRAYIARRRPAGEARPAGGQPTGDERELPIVPHVEPAATAPSHEASPATPAAPATPPAPSAESTAMPTPPRVAAIPEAPVVEAPVIEAPEPPAPEQPRPEEPPPAAPRRPTTVVSRAMATPLPEEAPSGRHRASSAASPTAPTPAPGGMPGETPQPPASPTTPALPTPPIDAGPPSTKPATRRTASLEHPAPPPTPPAGNSGRELLFFVIGAVLAGLAIALSR